MKNIRVILKLYDGHKIVSVEEALRLYENKEISPYSLYSFEGDTRTEIVSQLPERLKIMEKEAAPKEKPEGSKKEKQAISEGTESETPKSSEETITGEKEEPVPVEPEAESKQVTDLEEEEEDQSETELGSEPEAETEQETISDAPPDEAEIKEEGEKAEEEEIEAAEEKEHEPIDIEKAEEAEEEKKIDLKHEDYQDTSLPEETIPTKPNKKKNKTIFFISGAVVLVLAAVIIFLNLKTPNQQIPEEARATENQPTPENQPAPPETLSQYYEKERPKIISTLEQWNVIKTESKKNLTTSDIDKVLTDDALEKDLGGIKWLSDNNAYWDITRYEFEVTSVTFIDKNNAEALVAVLETGKYFQDGSLREDLSYYDSHYEVYYRLVKKQDRWYISEKPRKTRDL